jgi:hypothetical protein
VSVRAVLDCAQVPDVVPLDAYRLLMDAGRKGTPDDDRRRGAVASGPAGEVWRLLAPAACSGWRARTALTVTALTAVVHPSQPRAELSLSVTNSGQRAATLYRTATLWASLLSRSLPVEVAPGATARVPVTVVLDDCGLVVGDAGPGGWLSHSRATGAFGLASRSGPEPAATGSLITGPPDGIGVVLAPQTLDALRTAFHRMCGGIDRWDMSIPDGEVHLDEKARRLDLRVEVTVPPGRVRSLRFAPDKGGAPELSPLWTGTRDLVPDSTGTARAVLSYRTELPLGCVDGQPVGLEVLPSIRVMLAVPDGAVVRAVPLRTSLDLIGESVGESVVRCRSSG